MLTRECMYYSIEDGVACCVLCPFHCRISEGKVGRCRVRKHTRGKLVSLNYGRITSANLDPVEKKPLYHFHPGALVLSLGTFGCNLTCSFCQNWQISQGDPPSRELSPTDSAELASEHRESGNIGIAYTYNEPIIWYEYVMDTAKLVREMGMANILVTNGTVEEEPLEELLPYVDAMNVDIKSIRPEFYRRNCGGDGLAARRTVEKAWGRCVVEITNLIIPGENDSEEELVELFDWAASVSRRLPVHLSRYHPEHRMDHGATPSATLMRAYELARERLDFVYVGNILLKGTSDTVCPNCGDVAVQRSGFHAKSDLNGGLCPSCEEDLGIAT